MEQVSSAPRDQQIWVDTSHVRFADLTDEGRTNVDSVGGQQTYSKLRQKTPDGDKSQTELP